MIAALNRESMEPVFHKGKMSRNRREPALKP